jgi:hypothetical protein
VGTQTEVGRRRGDALLNDTQNRVRPTQCFEAAKSEAMRFILIVDRRDAEFPSQSVELGSADVGA